MLRNYIEESYEKITSPPPDTNKPFALQGARSEARQTDAGEAFAAWVILKQAQLARKLYNLGLSFSDITVPIRRRCRNAGV